MAMTLGYMSLAKLTTVIFLQRCIYIYVKIKKNFEKGFLSRPIDIKDKKTK